MGIRDCQLITLPKHADERGSLTFIESSSTLLPFEIQRVFYLYDVPAGQTRGAHAHRRLQQFFVCLSGQFRVQLDDGHEKKTVFLKDPWQGLRVPPMVWATESEFAPGTVCLVLASEKYDETDYIRQYDDFLTLVRRK